MRERDLPAVVSSDPRSRRDFHRFATFTQGWIARPGAEPDLLGDARYSSADERFAPVWGRFRPSGASVPIEWVDRSGASAESIRPRCGAKSPGETLIIVWSPDSGLDALRPFPRRSRHDNGIDRTRSWSGLCR